LPGAASAVVESSAVEESAAPAAISAEAAAEGGDSVANAALAAPGAANVAARDSAAAERAALVASSIVAAIAVALKMMRLVGDSGASQGDGASCVGNRESVFPHERSVSNQGLWGGTEVPPKVAVRPQV